MLIFNYGHKVFFSPRLFRIFKKWTKKMSKIENPKILLGKKSLKYNKFPKLLKGIYYKEPFYLPFDAFVTRFIVLKLCGRGGGIIYVVRDPRFFKNTSSFFSKCILLLSPIFSFAIS